MSLQASSLLLLVVSHGGRAGNITSTLCYPASFLPAFSWLPSLSRAVMRLAPGGKPHAITKGAFLTGAVVSAVARINRWPWLTPNSPLPSPLPSVCLVPALSCLPVPCLMPASNPSAPRGGLPSVPFILAQCSLSGAPRWRSLWVV